MMQMENCSDRKVLWISTKENIRGEYASLDNFIRQWSKEEKKKKIREMLLERGIDLELMKSGAEYVRYG